LGDGYFRITEGGNDPIITPRPQPRAGRDDKGDSMTKTWLAALSATLGLAAAGAIAAEQQGVSKNEILIGSIQDLSGPIAGFGQQVRLRTMGRGGGNNGERRAGART